MAPPVIAFPREVGVAAIEDEIFRLWREMAVSRHDSGEIMRACALNLVIVMPAHQDLDAMASMATEATSAHPARVILISTAPREPASLRAWIAARCRRVGGNGATICREEVRIAAGGDSVFQIDNAALSILLPDLPTFLWWHAPLPDGAEEEQVFANLAEQCERLIFDSGEFPHPSHDLPVVACLTPPPEAIPEIPHGGEPLPRLFTPHRAAVGDLTWHRLAPWRELLAHPFDHPRSWPLLDRIDRITIEHAAGGFPVQGTLLLGWLAGRLGWRPGKEGFLRGSETIETVCRPAPPGAPTCEAIHSVTIEMAGRKSARRDQHDVRPSSGWCPPRPAGRRRLSSGDPQDVVSVEVAGGRAFARLIDPHHAVSEMGMDDCRIPSRVVPIHPPEPAALLEQELSIMGHSPIYEEALRAAASLSSRWFP